MARLRLDPGVRYLVEGLVYVVRRVLARGQLLVENESFGGEAAVSRDQLVEAWARGELRFEVRGSNARRDADSPLATECAISDLEGASPARREEAWRRYRLILPLLQLPEGERTRHSIESYAAALQQKEGGWEADEEGERPSGKR